MNESIKAVVISKVISTIERNKDEQAHNYLLRLQNTARELSEQYDKNEEELFNYRLR